MFYYRIGYTTNFAGCDEDIIVQSETPVDEDEVVLWAQEEVQVSHVYEELDPAEIEDEEDIENWESIAI